MAYWQWIGILTWRLRVRPSQTAARTLPHFLVALRLPHGGLWMRHVATYGWPPTNQSQTPKSKPITLCHLAPHLSLEIKNSLTQSPYHVGMPNQHHVSSMDY